MNMKGEAAVTAAKVTTMGFPVTVEHMDDLARQIGEHSLFGRTGGAATLAVGMAQIFSRVVNGRWLDLWYHFAIMFEALFILTTIDAGTRVGRYLLQDVLGHIWSPLRDTRNISANLLASVLMVGAWGYFLIQGVRDPLGGVNSLWPLFGIANQMLAAIALCLATTILLKTGIGRAGHVRLKGAVLALVAVVPLVWLLAVTVSAGYQKIWHSDIRIGFLAQAHSLLEKRPALEQAVETAKQGGVVAAVESAEKVLRTNGVLYFNNMLDAVVAGVFLVLLAGILALSVYEWAKLLRGSSPPALHETPPVWLPEYAVSESGGARLQAAVPLAIALARELSGEAHIEREAQLAVQACGESHVSAACSAHNIQGGKDVSQAYLDTLDRRYKGVTRCC